MDEGKIKEALEGKVKLEELNEEELGEFRARVSDEAQKAREEADAAKNEVSGLREAKRAEQERVEALKREAEEIEEAKTKSQEELNKGKEEISQFRKEQIEKAKAKFLEQFPDAKDKIDEIDDKFSKLDSGKVDSEFILKDYVSAFAATDPDGYMSSREKAKQLEKNAAELNEKEAGSPKGGDPSGGEPKKYSEETTKLAKSAGISEEAADKVQKEGMTRRYN